MKGFTTAQGPFAVHRKVTLEGGPHAHPRHYLAAALCLGLAAPAVAGTKLILDSQPGDSIGQGVPRTFVPADGTFSAQKNFDEGVDVDFDGSEFWTLSFAAAGDVLLTSALFPDATRFPFQASTEHGLSVTGDGRGCNELRGAFQVHEISYGAGSTIDSFAADFVQYCDNATGPMIGAIRFNSSDLLPDVFDDDVDGVADIADNCLALANAEQLDSDLDGAGDDCDDSLEASFVVWTSEPGDYVGQGEFRHLHAGNAFFDFELEPDGAVGLDIEESTYWHLDFEAAGGGAPAVGVYEGATRYPFNGPTEPGLDVGGDGRGCNNLTGRFEVFEAEYGPGGEVLRFSADFEQHCEGAAPALRRAACAGTPPSGPATRTSTATGSSRSSTTARACRIRPSGTATATGAATTAASSRRHRSASTT